MPRRIYLKTKTFFSRHFSPTRIFVLSFAAVIITGGILLWFPFSASKGNLRFVDALFTSTSAVCVTGLVVLDVGKDLSTLGQVITIFLFQISTLQTRVSLIQTVDRRLQELDPIFYIVTR